MELTQLRNQLVCATCQVFVEKPSHSSAATGFWVSLEVDGFSHDFLVTNHHVVSGGNDQLVARVLFGEPATTDGSELQDVGIPLEGFATDVSNDLAVAHACGLRKLKLSDGSPIRRTISLEEFVPGPDELAELEAFEEIFALGYPRGIAEPTTGLPIVRRCLTATPLQVDYNGLPQFLVEGAIDVGHSGGPVVLDRYFPMMEPCSNPNHDHMNFKGWERKTYLLGVVRDAKLFYERVTEVSADELGSDLSASAAAEPDGVVPSVRTISHLGIATRSQEIADLCRSAVRLAPHA